MMPRAIWRRVRLERWVVYLSIAFVAAAVVWITTAWMDYLSERTEEARQQTKHMAELLERSARRQEQMATLIREFRDSVEDEKASRRDFERKADAILKALDVQVERMSHKPVSSTPRVRRVVGQAGGAPRPREPPREPKPKPEPPPAQAADETSPQVPKPKPAHDHPPKPKPRAEPQPPPRSQPPPQADQPPKAKRQPPANSQQTAPSRPGKADPPGKAKGHSKQPPAKGRR